jgi:hypothetical protein
VAVNAEAGLNSSVTVCSDAPPVDLFDALNGSPDPGGGWSDDSGTGALSGSVLDVGQLAQGSYPFTYSVAGIAPCTNDSAMVIVTVVAASNAGTDNAIVLCQNGSPIIMIDSLGGDPDPGGSWFPSSGIFDPATDLPGIYCYTVAGTAPCADASACLTITVLPSTDPACLGTGLGAPSSDQWLLVPSPADDLFTISWNEGGGVELTMRDVEGRVVFEGMLQGPTAIIHTATWRNGVYTAEIKHNGRSLTRRVMIVH